MEPEARDMPCPEAMALFEGLQARVMSKEALAMPLADVEAMIQAGWKEVSDCVLREIANLRHERVPDHDDRDILS
jgi:hypothetical protein